jgi:hypothetical protein
VNDRCRAPHRQQWRQARPAAARYWPRYFHIGNLVGALKHEHVTLFRKIDAPRYLRPETPLTTASGTVALVTTFLMVRARPTIEPLICRPQHACRYDSTIPSFHGVG